MLWCREGRNIQREHIRLGVCQRTRELQCCKKYESNHLATGLLIANLDKDLLEQTPFNGRPIWADGRNATMGIPIRKLVGTPDLPGAAPRSPRTPRTAQQMTQYPTSTAPMFSSDTPQYTEVCRNAKLTVTQTNRADVFSCMPAFQHRSFPVPLQLMGFRPRQQPQPKTSRIVKDGILRIPVTAWTHRWQCPWVQLHSFIQHTKIRNPTSPTRINVPPQHRLTKRVKNRGQRNR